MTPLALVLGALALAVTPPFRAEQPDVRSGNEHAVAGRPEEALKRYDAAEKAVGPAPEIAFDRGAALARQGRNADAAAAYREALARGAGKLESRVQQNLGSALAASGDREGAVRAFADALRADPANEDARWNLEVLLRQKSSGAGAPKDPGDGKGKPDPQPESSSGNGASPKPEDQPGQQGEQPRPQPPPPGSAKPPPKPGAKDGPEREAKAGAAPAEEQPGDGETAPGAPLDKQQAESLLDALRAREKTAPVAPGRQKGAGRRADAGRDW